MACASSVGCSTMTVQLMSGTRATPQAFAVVTVVVDLRELRLSGSARHHVGFRQRMLRIDGQRDQPLLDGLPCAITCSSGERTSA